MQPLSPKHDEVAHLIIQGLTRPEMASRLGINKSAVRRYIAGLYLRAGVHPRRGSNPRVEFTLWYIREYLPEHPQIAKWLSVMTPPERLIHLTPNEEAVAESLIQGYSGSKMAEMLSCTVRTVKSRVYRIRRLAGGNLSPEQLVVWIDKVYLPWRSDHEPGEIVRLSLRQEEVARLMIDGVPRAAIAQRMNVALSTVMTFIRQLYVKSGAHNRVQFARWYDTVYLAGADLIPPEPAWLKDMTQREGLKPLSLPAEKAAELLAQGFDNARMAEALGCSHSMVKVHLTEIRQLAGGERSRQRLVVWLQTVYLPWRSGT